MKKIEKSDVPSETWDVYLRALDGDAVSQNAMGDMYYGGKDVPRDPVEAARWYRLAADQDLPEAVYSLGYLYKYGVGVERNPQYAIEFFRLAAIAGFHKAEYHYGEALCRGENCERDLKRGVMFLERSCAKGNPYAPYELAALYDSGILGMEEPAKYLELLKISAARGYADAMHDYSSFLFRGERLERNPKEAFKWAKAAAEKGSVPAMYNTGVSYVMGNGVRKSIRQGRFWLEKAAESKHPKAAKLLQHIAEGQYGTKPNPKEAERWKKFLDEEGWDEAPNSYRLSDSAQTILPEKLWEIYRDAMAGDPSAQYEFAVALRDGDGVAVNIPLSKKWLHLACDNGQPEAQYMWAGNFAGDPVTKLDLLIKSSDQGYAPAQTELGRIYLSGKEVEMNLEKALYYLEKSASSGDIDALQFLGKAFRRGEPFPMDLAKSREYLEKASVAGNPVAQCELGILLYDSREFDEAAGWFRSAASQGDGTAMTWLAFLYSKGCGLRRNYDRYFEWACRAMEKKAMASYSYVADCYLNGLGTERDIFKAVETLEKGVLNNDSRSLEDLYELYTCDPVIVCSPSRPQALLEHMKARYGADDFLQYGVQCYLGDFMPCSFAKASRILRPMAEKGDMFACEIMGAMYITGRGVKQSYDKARYYFEKGAGDMSEFSFLMLSVLYHEGLGVEKDLGRSDEYLLWSAERGNPEAMRIMLSRERKIDSTLMTKNQPFPQTLYAAARGDYPVALDMLSKAPADSILAHMLRGMIDYLGLTEDSSLGQALSEFRQGGVICRGYIGECLSRMGDAKQACRYFRCSLYTLEPAGMRGLAQFGKDIVPNKNVERWAEDYPKLLLESLMENGQ